MTTKIRRVVEIQIYSFFNFGARWCGWSTPRTGRITPGIGTQYQTRTRLGRPHDTVERVLTISPPPGFDPRFVQPVDSLNICMLNNYLIYLS